MISVLYLNREPMKNIRIILVLMGFSILIFFWTINQENSQNENEIVAQKGRVNINEFKDSTVYRLKGEWEFYPSVLIQENKDSLDHLSVQYRQIEHIWIDDVEFDNGLGYATYRLYVSGLDPNMPYGILLEDAGSSYQLSVNNKLILQNGVISKNELLSSGASYTDKNVFSSNEKGIASIVLEVSNYERVDGGVYFAPLIGTVDEIIYYYETSLIIEMFVFSILISITMIFLLLAVIVKDERSFYMSMLAGLFAIRVISTGNHIIYLLNPLFEFPLIWVLRLEYLSVFLMLPIFTLLANTFKIFKFNQLYRNISYGFIITFILMGLVLDHSGLVFIYLIFQILVGGYGLHFLYYTFISYRNAHLNLVSIIVLGLSIIGALISIFFIQDTRYSFYFMVFIFTLFIATTVLYRFSIIHSRTEHLENIVKIDPLTKLWNRAYLSELKFDATKYNANEIFYVLFIDLNDFKEINDKYGHKIGDEVLRITARRLRNSCHESDMIFRLGGDEFIVIAHMKESSAIEKVIKRLRDNFNEPFTIGDLKLNLSLAIGYHAFNPEVDNFESVIALSDMKMYEDKRRQSNQ